MSVAYGTVTATLLDLAGHTPTGYVTFTPGVGQVNVPGEVILVPDREDVELVAGVLPTTQLVASNQVDGAPDTFQWTAVFHLDSVLGNPGPLTFTLPAGAHLDLSTIISETPAPGTVHVVHVEDRERAEEAADAAAQSAAAAATSASQADAAASDAAASAAASQGAEQAALDAAASAGAAAGSATAAAGSASAASTSAGQAATSATAAGTSAGAASTSAGQAGTSATAAAGSASAASTSATNAAASLAAMPSWWFGTQAAYNAIPVKDPNTLYAITG